MEKRLSWLLLRCIILSAAGRGDSATPCFLRVQSVRAAVFELSLRAPADAVISLI